MKEPLIVEYGFIEMTQHHGFIRFRMKDGDDLFYFLCDDVVIKDNEIITNGGTVGIGVDDHAVTFLINGRFKYPPKYGVESAIFDCQGTILRYTDNPFDEE